MPPTTNHTQFIIFHWYFYKYNVKKAMSKITRIPINKYETFIEECFNLVK